MKKTIFAIIAALALLSCTRRMTTTKSAAILLPITALALLPSSCVKDIVLDSKDKPAVVVECILTDAPEQRLNLSFARTPSQTEAQEFGDATAVLTDVTESRSVGQFRKGTDGFWELLYKPEYGHRYALDITVEGYGPIHAEDTMVKKPDVKYIDWDESSSIEPPIFPSFRGSRGSYYLISSLPHSSVWITGLYRDSETGDEFFASELCTDFPVTDDSNLSGSVYDGWPNFFPIFGLMYYLPSLIGYPMHKKYIRIPEERSGLDILDNQESNTYFLVSTWFNDAFHVRMDGITCKKGRNYLRFMTVSDVYDRYLVEAIYNIQAKEDDDITDIYMHENVYSNIEGGIGIFGSAAVQELPWNVYISLPIE